MMGIKGFYVHVKTPYKSLLSTTSKLGPTHKRTEGRAPVALSLLLLDPPADLISALKLRVLGELWFFAEAG